MKQVTFLVSALSIDSILVKSMTKKHRLTYWKSRTSRNVTGCQIWSQPNWAILASNLVLIEPNEQKYDLKSPNFVLFGVLVF